jgi:hypothetical protein
LILAQSGPRLLHGKRIDLDLTTHALTPLIDYRGQYYALPESAKIRLRYFKYYTVLECILPHYPQRFRAMKSWPAARKAATQLLTGVHQFSPAQGL